MLVAKHNGPRWGGGQKERAATLRIFFSCVKVHVWCLVSGARMHDARAGDLIVPDLWISEVGCSGLGLFLFPSCSCLVWNDATGNIVVAAQLASWGRLAGVSNEQRQGRCVHARTEMGIGDSHASGR